MNEITTKEWAQGILGGILAFLILWPAAVAFLTLGN